MSDERMETQTLTDFEALLLEEGGWGRKGEGQAPLTLGPASPRIWVSERSEWNGEERVPALEEHTAERQGSQVGCTGGVSGICWGGRTVPAWRHANSLGLRTHQSLLDKQAEQDGIAHLPQALEHVGLELCVFDDVLQLVVKELQDPWEV